MRHNNVWVILGLGALGALLTAWATIYVLDSSDVEAEARFSLATDRVAQTLSNRMIQYEQGLMAGAALITAADAVDRAAWGRFVAGLSIRTRFPGIQAMGLAAWVPDTAREEHVATVRRSDLPTYAIRPPGDRATYLPILFNEPYEGRNRAVVGFDMLSEPIRRAAITRAASLGEPAMSGMVVLAGENPNDRPPGFVIYVPAQDAAGELKAMVFAPFRVKDLVEAVLKESSSPGLSVTLKDGQDVLYEPSETVGAPRYSTWKELSIAGRIWRLNMTGDARFLSSTEQLRAWIVGGSGAAVTLALIGSLTALFRSRIAERRFRIFSDLGSDWVWEQDANQRFTYFNDPQEHYRGANRDVIGMTRAELMVQSGDPSEHDRHQELLARMQNHEPIRDFEYRSQTAAGSTAVIRLSAEPKFNAHGRFDGYAGIAKDVTTERARDAALRSAMRTAEMANTAKSYFLATMSHELRTPLNAIIGFAEIIENRHFGPEQMERYFAYAGDIRQSGAQLLALVNDILDLAKIESGQLALALIPVDAAETVAECVSTLSDMASRKELTVDLSITGPALVLADPRSLRQILLNLLSNAVKFTPQGGKIAVSGVIEGDQIVVIVKDTGIGIPKQAQAKIFTPFYQADPSVSARHGGTGLGLTISKLLAEAMGGSLTLESEENEGTTMTLRLVTAPRA